MRFYIIVTYVFLVLLSTLPGRLATRNGKKPHMKELPSDTVAANSRSSKWSLPFSRPAEPDNVTPKRRQVPAFRGDESRILFPTQRAMTTTHSPKVWSTSLTTVGRSSLSPRLAEFESQRNGVPVSLFWELSNVTNPVDFLYRYVIEAPASSDPTRPNSPKNTLNNSYGSSFLRERTLNAPFAHGAGCTPQPTTVPIEMNAEPYIMYFPSCTRVDRCDGCCNTDLLECTATKTDMTRLQVLKVKYLGPDVNKFDVSEPVVVELERHLQCDCECRVKASDCRFYQVYRPNECRCECTNQDDAASCMGDRFWDLNTCKCRCREHLDCSTGFFFNVETCSCEVMRSSRFANGPGFRGF